MADDRTIKERYHSWLGVEPSRTWSPYYPVWLETKRELEEEMKQEETRNNG